MFAYVFRSYAHVVDHERAQKVLTDGDISPHGEVLLVKVYGVFYLLGKDVQLLSLC